MSVDFEQAIRTAIGAHGVWKLRLRQAVMSGKSDTTPAQVSCDDQCDFGRWLYGPTIPATLRTSAAYGDVRAKHAAFHASAGQVLTDALAGRKVAADQRLGDDFNTRSTALVRAMSDWLRDVAPKSAR